ncbi:MAG: DUF5810 domain-containing protein [Halanaeroarchaeum sp.]
MGYACPVCEEPQVDAEHLANHLAFTAMISDEGHEAWLDEHVEDWGSMGPADLGPLVAEHAESVDLDVPEGVGEERPATRVERPQDPEALTAADREILEEARELSRRMAEDSESE